MNARRNLTPLFHLLFSYPLFLTHYYTLASFSLTKHCHCCNFTASERLPYKKEGLGFPQGTGKALKNFSHQELSHKALALHTYCFLLPTCSSICFILIKLSIRNISPLQWKRIGMILQALVLHGTVTGAIKSLAGWKAPGSRENPQYKPQW